MSKPSLESMIKRAEKAKIDYQASIKRRDELLETMKKKYDVDGVSEAVAKVESIVEEIEEKTNRRDSLVQRATELLDHYEEIS